MDWKSKYLKYKTKYLNLKNKNTISLNELDKLSLKDYFDLLKLLYPNCVKKTGESNDPTQTYGEMEYEGIENLNKIINPNETIKYFLDIGSGRGKLPCWFAGINNIVKSIGIEIVKARCTDANELKLNLSKKYPNYTDKIIFVSGSFEDYNLGGLVDNNPNTLVWISNLCFGHELTEKVFTQILNQMQKGTICCCSQKPSDLISDISSNPDSQNKLKFEMSIQIQMSWWDKLSDVFVYKIV